MNILLTNVGPQQDREYLHLINDFRVRHHIVEEMPYDRIEDYLRFDYASTLAAIDAIVCYAEMPPEREAYGVLVRADKLGEALEKLPDQCAMFDGRKWKSVPFIVITSTRFYFGPIHQLQRSRAKLVDPSPHNPDIVINAIRDEVDRYMHRILDDYNSMGIIVTFDRGHARIGPALHRKPTKEESDYYSPSADRRQNRRWLTVMRDDQGLRIDVELFQELIDRKATETQMQHFFEENPAFLMQARLGIPVPHIYYENPNRWSPDFALSPILGPGQDRSIEFLELKGPSERLVNSDRLHRGFSYKVHKAIDQVRDYARFMDHPDNIQQIVRQIGYVPSHSRVAVLIGRDPETDSGKDTYARRQSEVDVKVITYDQIFQTQVDQLSKIDLQKRFMNPSIILPQEGVDFTSFPGQ